MKESSTHHTELRYNPYGSLKAEQLFGYAAGYPTEICHVCNININS